MERKSVKPVKKKKIPEQDQHIYDRFMKEDCKTKKDQVDTKRDSLILNFIHRKEKDESIRRSKQESDTSPTFKIKNQIQRKNLLENSME